MNETTENSAEEQEPTAYDVIDAILNLSDEEKANLPVLIRTDPDGIKAYTCFLYGNCTEYIPDEG